MKRIISKKILVLMLLALLAVSASLQAQEIKSVSPAAATKYYKTEGQLHKVSQWGSTYNKKMGKLYWINSFIVAPDGTYFIGMTDGLDDFTRISHFSADGKFINWFGGYQNGIAQPDSLTSTQGLVCLPDYTAAICQALRLEAKQFTFAGDVKNSWKLDHTYYAMPSYATSDKLGNIYNVDSYNQQVNKYSYKGKLLWSHKAEGSGLSQSKPHSLAINKEGELYYLDTAKDRIVVLDDDGKAKRTFGKKGDAPDNFSGASFIATGADGVLFILERRRNANSKYDFYLKRYSEDNRYLGRLQIKAGATREYLWNISQVIAVGPEGFLYLAEASKEYNFARVIKYARAYYKPQGNTGRIVGKIKGVSSDEMKYMTVMIEGVQDGVPFFATVRPKANGKYKITKFPIGVDFTIRLLGYNTMKYECDELLGTGDKVVKKQNLKVVKK